MKNLPLVAVLDSNEYIFALGLFKKPSCELLLDTILENLPSFFIRIPRTIAEEVRKNLTQEEFKEFMIFVNSATNIDEDTDIPFELGAKYETLGLKSADALIAAYVEWVGAAALVTENRHFLTRQPNLPFKVINAEDCLKFIKSSLR